MTKGETVRLIEGYLNDPPNIAQVRWSPSDEESWGSVQYSTVESTYKTYWKARETLSPDEVQEAFGINSVQLGSIETAKSELATCLEEVITDGRSEEDPDDPYDFVKSHREALGRITDCSDLKADELFEILRDLSWDLWGTANFLGQTMVNPAYVSGAPPEAPGLGPEINVELQSNNIHIGLLCAMLVDFGYVESSECFKGFDT